MIEFVTLFLGLVMGPSPVELAVEEGIGAVELLLDGRAIERLEGPPWSTTVDFGSRLEPHLLEAVALDDRGRRLARTRQWINYRRADYAAAILLGPPGESGARTGRVVWVAVLDRNPQRLQLRFDSTPLPVDRRGGFVLPRYNSASPHFLAAELLFEDGLTVHTELAFGGVYGQRMTSALTAVPITSRPQRPWSPPQVQGCLQVDGAPLRIFTTSAGRGRLLVLKDERLQSDLPHMSREDHDQSADTGLSGYELTAISSQPEKGHDTTFRLVDLGPLEDPTRLSSLLLSGAPLVHGRRSKKAQKLWDALAVAGRSAASADCPRAVLLALSSDPRDRSRIRFAQARHYLRSMRVPLYVWAPDRETLAARDVEGDERTFIGAASMERLVRRIALDLASQTIVWVEGEHLPARIALSADAPPGVELVH